MALLHPTALLLLLLALPIVVLLYVRARPKRHRVGTGFLWQRAVESAGGARAGWRRWRRAATVCAELTILAFLVMAAADPRVPAPKASVLVLDVSASMEASDGDTSRLEAAKGLAAGLLGKLPAGFPAALLTAGSDLTVRCRLTDDRDALQSALEAVGSGSGRTRVVEAVALARRLLVEESAGRIIVLTDGGFPGADELAQAEDVDLRLVGSSGRNIAVSRLATRRAAGDPRCCQVLAQLESFSGDPVNGRFVLNVDGRPLESVPVELPPAGRWQRTFELKAVDSGEVVGRWEGADDLAADNRLATRFPAAPARRLTLVGAGSPYLEEVLRERPLVEVSTVAQPPAAAEAGRIAVLQGEVPPVLPEGPLLVIGPRGPCDLWQLGEPLENSEVGRQDNDSRLTADLSLLGTWLGESPQVLPSGAASMRPLAWTTDDVAVLFSIERPGGRVVLLLGDLEKGDLAGQPTFEILVANALEWLAGGDETTPRWATVEIPASESDLRVPSVRTGADDASETPSAGRLWIVLAAVGLLLLIVEWALYQRRWVG